MAIGSNAEHNFVERYACIVPSLDSRDDRALLIGRCSAGVVQRCIGPHTDSRRPRAPDIIHRGNVVDDIREARDVSQRISASVFEGCQRHGSGDGEIPPNWVTSKLLEG